MKPHMIELLKFKDGHCEGVFSLGDDSVEFREVTQEEVALFEERKRGILIPVSEVFGQ